MSNQNSLQSAAFAHQYVRIDGHRIHCVTAGSGTPVLLIPGWPQTWYAWRHVMHALAEQGFMAIAVDLPGTGYSDRPDAGYDTGHTAATLHRTMVQLGFDTYLVAGHDVGMWVAYALASDRPDAVRALALTEAVIPGLAPAPPIFVPPEDNIFLWHFMFNQLADLPETLIAGRERAYLDFMFDRWSFRRDCVAVDVYAQAYAAPGGLRGGFAYYRAIPETIHQNLARAERKLGMPVLAIGAEHATRDAPLITLRDHAVDLQGIVVPDCGHFIMEEAADAFIGHLLPFLERSR
ncbi:alpha/beta hydrolase [Burkholderia stagnalis]|uniref:alpha/beta fold hydrolase n=1 Tax=Burkholderia stagnalis TaxID=1503054 RepID=UPI00075C8E41|nr:alpha/beta hydrolase [Burkholderia stagnalis]KVN25257.1 alpha/beta hydrolase [Burkholderia stagnalis]